MQQIVGKPQSTSSVFTLRKRLLKKRTHVFSLLFCLFADAYITNVDAQAQSDDDEDEEPGAMVKADAGVIAGRKIAKGGRKKRDPNKQVCKI